MDRSEYIRQNVEQFHSNTAASPYQQSGLTDQSAKLNNAGFNKLMDYRGYRWRIFGGYKCRWYWK